MRREAILAGLCASVACAGNDERTSGVFGDGGDDGDGTAAESASASATDTSADDGDGDGDDGADDGIFDVGSGMDLPGQNCPEGSPEDCHCNAVDLLFVVDNSGSMGTHRDPITNAFPMFVDEMVTALPPGTDLHVGLTRATGFYDPGDAGGWSGPECEASITDGVFFPPTDGNNGVNGQQGRLFEHDGMTHFAMSTDEDPGPLAAWFGGALAGTIDGFVPHSNTETVVAGAAYPFHPINEPFNAGFMRQNAVLVLFLVSDSPDLTPPAIPTDDFIQIVRDAKSECGEICIITSGAIAGSCYGQPANTNTRLFDFMNAFGKPPASFVSLDAFMSPDFTGVLGTALADAVATTCDEIRPEG